MAASTEYKKLVTNYYGRPLPGKKKSRQASVIITRAFDDGKPLPVPASSDYIEYDVVSRSNSSGSAAAQSLSEDSFTEYDIAGNDSFSAVTAGMDTGVYIEPFTEEPGITDSQPASFSQPAAPCGCAQNDRGADRQTPSVSQASYQPPVAPGTTQPWIEENQAKDLSVTENDFLSDIKSILGGQKVYDKTTRKLSDAQSESPKEPGGVNDSYHGVKDLPSTENKHQIFEQIAKSMRYANAYDLGSISLDQTFDDFDRMQEISTKTKQTPTKQPAKPVVQNNKATASSADFIEDLDIITQQSYHTALEAVTIDPATGGAMITAADLEPGDIVIAVKSQPSTGEGPLAAGTSHAGFFTGNGQLIEFTGGTISESTLDSSLASDSIAVAYRHTQMTPDGARRMLNFLRASAGRQSQHYALVKITPSNILNVYCKKVPGSQQEACRNSIAHFRPGTDRNDEFYCSEWLLQAFADAGLNITQTLPSWPASENVVRVMDNGTLSYTGHLKA